MGSQSHLVAIYQTAVRALRPVTIPLRCWFALALTFLPGAALAQADPDEEAKLNAKGALVSARIIYLTTRSYTGVTAKLLKEKYPELRVLDDGPSTGPAVLSLKVVTPTRLQLAVFGGKICWGIREEGRQGGVATLYAKGSRPPGSCTATSFKDADFIEHERVWKP